MNGSKSLGASPCCSIRRKYGFDGIRGFNRGMVLFVNIDQRREHVQFVPLGCISFCADECFYSM